LYGRMFFLRFDRDIWQDSDAPLLALGRLCLILGLLPLAGLLVGPLWPPGSRWGGVRAPRPPRVVERARLPGPRCSRGVGRGLGRRGGGSGRVSDPISPPGCGVHLDEGNLPLPGDPTALQAISRRARGALALASAVGDGLDDGNGGGFDRRSRLAHP